MFGFLYAPSVKCGSEIRSEYRSLFCGLSCQLAKDYHQGARFLVNRDATFLSLVGAGLSDAPLAMDCKTCCNPLSTPRDIVGDDVSLSYAAAVTVSGLAVKLDDNAQDESGWRGLLPKMGQRLVSGSTDKAVMVLNSMGFSTKKVLDDLGTQTEIEERGAGLSLACEPTAMAYGEIFGHLAVLHGLPDLKGLLEKLGGSLGRLIYWRDAVDDWADDEKRGRFNPLSFDDAERLPALVEKEFESLQSCVAEIPWNHHAEMLESVVSHSIKHHQDMTKPPARGKKKKRKKKDKGDKGECCLDCYDCSAGWHTSYCCCDAGCSGVLCCCN